ncbi:hypothetical protein [Metabacillus fastidiosus]|uniref:hypothetical protein n=1 Tax=Metabacillus fastidiosus TaxID=1458 RepID=UPI003D2732BA
MRIEERLNVTSISLDGFQLPVPEGLSELLNISGAWVYQKEDKAEEKNHLNKYDRKVVMESGRLRTYLTYRTTSTKKFDNKKIS